MTDNVEIKITKTGLFDAHSVRDDHWIKIGVDTGRFAGPFSIAMGLDSSDRIFARATAHGIETNKDIADTLPFIERKSI